MDVKPDLKDLKPKPSSDGKMSCVQCGKRVNKCHLSVHVRGEHLPGDTYECLLCPTTSKRRDELARHQKSQHGTKLSSETFSDSASPEVLKDWVELCFGESKDEGYAGLRCRPCDKQIRKLDLKQHVSSVHLKKPMYKCRLCDFVSTTVHTSQMNNHVKKVHGKAPGTESIDRSPMEQYEPIIKAMIGKLFEK